jgi:hypothetical protein
MSLKNAPWFWSNDIKTRPEKEKGSTVSRAALS